MRNVLTLYLHYRFEKGFEEIKEIITLKLAGDWDELQNKYFSLRQSQTKFMKQCQEIKQN